VVLNGTFFDPGLKDAHTLLWQVSADNGQVIPDGTEESLAFTPVDDGLYTATFTVTDNDGGVGVDSVVITVKNVAPSIALAGEDTAIEAEPYTLTLGPVNDPGDDTVTGYIVHWGDGETNTYADPGTVTHAYLLPGVTQTVAIDLVDEDGTHANAAMKEILVVSAAPDITDLQVDSSLIQENDMVTLTGEFEQLGLAVAHTVTVDWGDGNTSTLVLDPPAQPGTESFVLVHQYLDDDPAGTASDAYTIHVTVADNDGDTDSGTVSLTVLNAAPVLTGVSATDVLENGVTTLAGTISDPGTMDAFTLDVSWGDPLSPDNVQQFTFAAGTTNFTLSHRYLDDNPNDTAADTYTVSLILSDDDTGEFVSDTTLTVFNAAPEMTSLVSSAPEVGDAQPGDVVTVSGLFSDLGTLDTHLALIDWGDDTVTSAVINQAEGSFSGTHAYTMGGIFDIAVALSDDDLGSAEGWTAALVTGARVKDGELQVVGTHGRDRVNINEVRGKHYKVHATFLPGRCHYLTFNASDVESIKILMGDGDDHVIIAGNIDLPAILDGGAGNDHLKAGRGPTLLIGGEGNDLLIGGSGDDQIYGGDGDDRIFGHRGSDVIDGGAGNDKIVGNSGKDTIFGGSGSDWIYSGSGDDEVAGNAGNDWISGGSGSDDVSGGDGDDLIFGGSGDDRISGDGGSDLLFGGWGDDQISGGEGDDILIGGFGEDSLDGGPGDNQLIDGHRMRKKFKIHHEANLQPGPAWVTSFVVDTKTTKPYDYIKIELSGKAINRKTRWTLKNH
jgi:Ca2+-binding RTX toxin-like protein